MRIYCYCLQDAPGMFKYKNIFLATLGENMVLAKKFVWLDIFVYHNQNSVDYTKIMELSKLSI